MNVNDVNSKNVDDILSGIEISDLKNTMQKGNFGEMKMDRYYKQLGYERVSLDKVTGLDDASHQGIDGVYYKPNEKPLYAISEAKFSKAKLKNSNLDQTNEGKQMSSNWINIRLDKAVGKEMADKIRMESILNPDNVQHHLIHITPEGAINKLDKFARKLK